MLNWLYETIKPISFNSSSINMVGCNHDPRSGAGVGMINLGTQACGGGDTCTGSR